VRHATFPRDWASMKPRSSSDPLEELDTRIKQAQKKPEAEPSGAHQAFRMGTDLVAGVLVGSGFGYFVDQFFGTLPLFLIIFVFIGAAAGIKMMIESSMRYSQTKNEEEL